MPKISGGCLCGSVRYTSDTEPAWVAVCHCANCQKNRGSAFSLNLAMPTDSATITGDSLATYEDRGGASGNPFFGHSARAAVLPISESGKAYSGLTFIKAGTLDDPSWVKPGVHMWCSDKQPWVVIEEGVAQTPRNPG